MSGDVLVFRSVSVERLPDVLAACRARWPGARLAVLTSANRSGEVASEAHVHEVVSLPSGFADLGPHGHPVRQRRFSAVVVPLAGRSCFGYGNLLQAAAALDAQEYHLAYGAARLEVRSRYGLRCLATLEAMCLWLARQPAALVARRWAGGERAPRRT